MNIDQHMHVSLTVLRKRRAFVIRNHLRDSIHRRAVVVRKRVRSSVNLFVKVFNCHQPVNSVEFDTRTTTVFSVMTNAKYNPSDQWDEHLIECRQIRPFTYGRVNPVT
jgi:hypothetical protein